MTESKRATTVFKLLNPELFVKPRVWVGVLGTGAFIGGVGFLIKHNLDTEWRNNMELKREQELKREEEEAERRRQLDSDPYIQRMRKDEEELDKRLKALNEKQKPPS